MARAPSNLDRFIPGSPKGLYAGLKFGKTFQEGTPLPVVGAAIGPLLRGQAVPEDVVGTLQIGGIVVKSKTVAGKTLDLHRYQDEHGDFKYIVDRASFIDVDGEIRVVDLQEDNVRYLEVWSGIWDIRREMEVLQLVQDDAFPRHGGLVYNGGQEVVAAKGKRKPEFKPQAQDLQIGLVGVVGEVIVWDVSLFRMPYTPKHGSEILLRSDSHQWLAVATPKGTRVEPAEADNYLRDWDDLADLRAAQEKEKLDRAIAVTESAEALAAAAQSA